MRYHFELDHSAADNVVHIRINGIIKDNMVILNNLGPRLLKISNLGLTRWYGVFKFGNNKIYPDDENGCVKIIGVDLI